MGCGASTDNAPLPPPPVKRHHHHKKKKHHHPKPEEPEDSKSNLEKVAEPEESQKSPVVKGHHHHKKKHHHPKPQDPEDSKSDLEKVAEPEENQKNGEAEKGGEEDARAKARRRWKVAGAVVLATIPFGTLTVDDANDVAESADIPEAIEVQAPQEDPAESGTEGEQAGEEGKQE